MKTKYKVTLKVNEKTYEAKGDTLLDAVSQIHVDFPIKTKGILRVEKDGKTAERTLNALNIRRIQAKNDMRAIVCKHLEVCLKFA